MKKHVFVIGFMVVLVGFLLVLPTYAQDEAQPEAIPVSGTITFTPPEILSQIVVGGAAHLDVRATGEWSGDIAGTDTYTYRVVIEPSGAWDAASIAEFEGTVLGDYEGTLLVWSVWKQPSETAGWHAEWWVLSGTGDLDDVYGRGFIWGPGETGLDYEYSGSVFFAPPAED